MHLSLSLTLRKLDEINKVSISCHEDDILQLLPLIKHLLDRSHHNRDVYLSLDLDLEPLGRSRTILIHTLDHLLLELSHIQLETLGHQIFVVLSETLL